MSRRWRRVVGAVCVVHGPQHLPIQDLWNGHEHRPVSSDRLCEKPTAREILPKHYITSCCLSRLVEIAWEKSAPQKSRPYDFIDIIIGNMFVKWLCYRLLKWDGLEIRSRIICDHRARSGFVNIGWSLSRRDLNEIGFRRPYPAHNVHCVCTMHWIVTFQSSYLQRYWQQQQLRYVGLFTMQDCVSTTYVIILVVQNVKPFVFFLYNVDSCSQISIQFSTWSTRWMGCKRRLDVSVLSLNLM